MNTELRRATLSLTALRVVVSVLIAVHGWARLIAGAVEPFGGWLGEQGFPMGLVIAYTVTAVEILGTPLLALGRFVPYLCVLYAGILLGGLVLVHAPEGWFVVGLGRNGMEYSVLLIAYLVGIGFQHIPGMGNAHET